MTVLISIHVPREGHDGVTISGASFADAFQSTCPARGTTPTATDRAKAKDYTCPARGTTIWRYICGAELRKKDYTCPARGTTANMHNFFVQICARVTNIPLKGMPYLQKNVCKHIKTLG